MSYQDIFILFCARENLWRKHQTRKTWALLKLGWKESWWTEI